MEAAGMPTRYTVAKQALDEAMDRSCNLQELRANLIMTYLAPSYS